MEKKKGDVGENWTGAALAAAGQAGAGGEAALLGQLPETG